MKFYQILGIVAILLTGKTVNCRAQEINEKKQPVDYVDNFIGVRKENSNCVIGPQLPFGSINPSPQTVNGSHDGYNPNEPIRGFGQLHVSGTGYGTNGQIFISPQIGLKVTEESHDSPKSGETATPFEYKVTLDRYKITTAVTPSIHSAIYRFTFPKSADSHIVFDITHHLVTDIMPGITGVVHEGAIQFDPTNKSILTGYGVYEGGWARAKYAVYFAAELSRTPDKYGTFWNGKIKKQSEKESLILANDRVGAWVNFNTAENEDVYLKISVSYKSIEQAKVWLNEEIPAFDYDAVKSKAHNIWNNALSKIEVEGGTEREKTIFYSALYHAQLMPRNRTNDTNQFADGVPMWDDHFAVWDTWRTAFPLNMLINPEMVSGVVNSFIARYKKNGAVWDSYVNGNDMIRGLGDQGGNNIDNIIAEAYLKKILGVDWTEAYKLLKFDADSQRLGSYAWRKQDSINNTYKTLGWIPSGIMNVSMTLEYAYNDFCVAQVAKGMGKVEDYNKYLERSKKWVELWNPEAESDGFKGFIMPKDTKGNFVKLDPKQYPGSWKNYFYEASSWTYSYFAPHQFDKIVQLQGGNEIFVKRLKHAFENKLINYYNEPSFLAAQQFHYAGRSDLASYYTRWLMGKEYTELGYPENDDSGAMSSWYIFSALGIFPNAGQDIYYLTGPLFKKATIHLPENKTLTILANNASPENIYVKSVKFNGKKIKGFIINHNQIAGGGTLEFDMSPMIVQ